MLECGCLWVLVEGLRSMFTGCVVGSMVLGLVLLWWRSEEVCLAVEELVMGVLKMR